MGNNINCVVLICSIFYLNRFGCAFVITRNHVNSFTFTYDWTAGSARHRQRVLRANLDSKEGEINDADKVDGKVSRRLALLDKLGIMRESKGGSSSRVKKSKKEKIPIHTAKDLEDYYNDSKNIFRKKNSQDIDYDTLLERLSVVGDTQIIGSPSHPDIVHPTARLIHERRRNGSKPSKDERPDGCKIALSIEGGGMRGCVTAGMVSALYYLGLEDCFDVVYGASAGTVIGAYFITRQFPWFGPEIYYDSLTTAGNSFIDTKRLLRSVGLGLLDPRLLKDVVSRRNNGKPVLNLDFLLEYTVQEKKPLNWDKFVDMQSKQPLKIVTSGCKSESSVILDMENGSFNTLEELARCMHASCLLPGIAGPILNLDTRNSENTLDAGSVQRFLFGNDINEDFREPLADALVYEPLPYRSAISEGATHVVVLRSRPDGADVTGKSSIFERMIMRRFFLRKNKLENIYKYMRSHRHKKQYAEDVITLNEAAKDYDRDHLDKSAPHLMPIAIAPGFPEISRLETRREEIFEGVRRGFARTYDAFVEDPNERGRGYEVAKQYFPDEILNYNPLEIHPSDDSSSAFETYIKQNGLNGMNDATLVESFGKTALELGKPR